jgi:hypothetical protein
MLQKPLADITAQDIQSLLDNGIPEGSTLEYKRELPSGRDEDKREFLADVSSFANTSGGDIIYGVEESQGVISKIVGLPNTDLDAEKLRLESLIRDGLEPRIISTLHSLPTTAGQVLIVRVEKSWIGPHRVVSRGHDKFYGRTSAGKFPLDVGQLRLAFTLNATVSERIRSFRADRMIEILNDRGPVSIVDGPSVLLHLVPLGAFSDQQTFDVKRINLTNHRLWTSTASDISMTFDGALVSMPPRDNSGTSVYTHFNWNGILESVTTRLLEHEYSGQRVIPHSTLERELLDYVPHCLSTLHSIGVRAPIVLGLSLLKVHGLRMATRSYQYSSPIRERNLVLPGTIIEDFSVSAISLLRPLFDRIWNACGLQGSQNFDAQGAWSPRLY